MSHKLRDMKIVCMHLTWQSALTDRNTPLNYQISRRSDSKQT